MAQEKLSLSAESYDLFAQASSSGTHPLHEALPFGPIARQRSTLRASEPGVGSSQSSYSCTPKIICDLYHVHYIKETIFIYIHKYVYNILQKIQYTFVVLIEHYLTVNY